MPPAWTTEEAVRNALSPFYSDEITFAKGRGITGGALLPLLISKLNDSWSPIHGVTPFSSVVQQNAPDLLDFYPLDLLSEADAIRNLYDDKDAIDFIDLLSLNPLATESPGAWYSTAVDGQNTIRALRHLRLMFFLNPNANEALLRLTSPQSFDKQIWKMLRHEIHRILLLPFLSDEAVQQHPERRVQLLQWLAGYMTETGRPRTSAALLSQIDEARQPEPWTRDYAWTARPFYQESTPSLQEEFPTVSYETFLAPLKTIHSITVRHKRRIAEGVLGLLDDLLRLDPPATPLQHLATTMSLVRSLERALGIAPQSYFLDRVL